MGEKKKKRTFGPTGSAISRADAFTGWHPGMSPDVSFRYVQHFGVPPTRMEPESMDAETFKELLAEQDQRANERAEALEEVREAKEKKMTKELFFKIHNDPLAKQGYEARKAKERLIQALEYRKSQDEYLWINEQIFILEAYIDNKRQEFKEQAHDDWENWRDNMLKKIQDRYPKWVETEGPIKAKELAEFGWEYIQNMEPSVKEPHVVLKQIRRRMRKLTLRREYDQRREVSEELSILGTGTGIERIPRHTRKKLGIKEIWEETPEQDDDFVVKVSKREMFRERAKDEGYTDREVNHFLTYYIDRKKKR